jgi:EAL domain-containing protein (putative c-di-GMP-specific phosphodiesterase class I)/GGDEF domain-containing protein
MSLKTQLWIAVAALMLLSFLVSVGVSTLSAQHYLSQQLHLKNVDNAASLALSLTQLPKDDATVELALAAQFDTGHYRLIRLVSPRGEILQERINEADPEGVPKWFVTLMEFDIEPGVAHVSEGWTQFGTLTVESQTSYAYESLWDGTRRLALIFASGAVLIGLLGTLLLNRTVRPLDEVVNQAEAIGNRRFVTVAEPSTREFRRVVAAMNLLSSRIKNVLEQEAARLDRFQRDAHIDKVTGLVNREPFMQTLESILQSEDANATGTLTLIRVTGLADLNKTYGRKAIDSLLASVGNTFNRMVSQHSCWAASRLNGSDFAILAPTAIEANQVALAAQDGLREVLEQHSMEDHVTLPSAATVYALGDTIADLLTRLDGALQSAEQQQSSQIVIARMGENDAVPVREQLARWRHILEEAFREEDAFHLATFPVVDLEGRLLHLEAPVRLSWRGETLPAGRFVPWVNRLEMSSALDKRVVELALDLIHEKGKPIGVNLSVGSLIDPGFVDWIRAQLAVHPHPARNLWLELPEDSAFRHLDSFKSLCRAAKDYHCKMGIEHVGRHLAEMGKLHDIGLDYIKADASFVRDLPNNPANQTLLRTLCTVGHSIGVTVIAEGVLSDEEWPLLEALGLDGVTGPGITSFQ